MRSLAQRVKVGLASLAVLAMSAFPAGCSYNAREVERVYNHKTKNTIEREYKVKKRVFHGAGKTMLDLGSYGIDCIGTLGLLPIYDLGFAITGNGKDSVFARDVQGFHVIDEDLSTRKLVSEKEVPEEQK